MKIRNNRISRWACAASIGALSVLICGESFAQTPAPVEPVYLDDIVVTAQKRSESINDVGMSITAATGNQLLERGITDVSQLAKVVPGFSYNATGYGTPIYTIRGVGFQESSLGASPAVSVYVDQIPLPFAEETRGATLDLERVEVLKGPQGTFFGQNSTGGAINYVAARPLNHFAVGVDAGYSRFNTIDLSGFVTGPLTDTLRVRLSGRLLRSGDWQRSLTRNDGLGEADQLYGRFLTEWEPTSRLKVAINLNGWRDKSDSMAAQLLDPRQPLQPLFPNAAYEASPVAPANARAADWDPGKSYRQNNRFYQVSGRIDYEIFDDITLTSISAYSRYDRDQRLDTDGSAVANFVLNLGGNTKTFFEELRLSGRFGSNGNWLIGANYQDDKVNEEARLEVFESSQAFLGATPVNQARQSIKTKSVFANADYEIAADLTLLGGLRYSTNDRNYSACTRDAGDGLIVNSVVFGPFGLAPGSCVTFLDNGTFGTITNSLDQNNLSWRVGLNYKPNEDTLVYGTVSKGWKAGSFPLQSLALEAQSKPVTQEGLLAYELGFKAKIDRTLQLNAAAFYYNYDNKQIRGLGSFPPFGSLEILINVPKSRVVGFEANAVWRPVAGLTISPGITLVDSKIKGSFVSFDPVAALREFGGEAFPYTPRWSGNTDVDYRFDLNDRLTGFVGGNVSYRTGTNGAFGELPQFDIKGYALLDLRAGVEGPNGRWRATVWGQNVTNKYYWTTATILGDGVVRYAGRPITYGVSLTYRY